MARPTPRLYAPTIDGVDLVIDGHDAAMAMVADEAPGWWRCPDDLAADDELRYRFRLRSRSHFSRDQQVEVLDPEARAVSDDGAWSLDAPALHRGFDWHHDDHRLPEVEPHVIAEIYIQNVDGKGGGGFRDVIDHLPYLVDLGITVIQLLPVEQGPGGWGYTPTHCFAVERRYGTRADLAALVDAAHGSGIAVLLDGIYNHAHQEIPLAAIDHDLWFHHEPKDPDTAWGPQFDYRHHLDDDGPCPALDFAHRRLGYWIGDFHIDGIRFDATRQIDDFEILQRLHDTAHELAGDKPFTCIAEHLPEDPAVVGPDGPMDRCWRESFGRRARTLLGGGWDDAVVEALVDCRHDGYRSGGEVVNYLSSHDLGHCLHHLCSEAGLDEDQALRRMELGYTLLLTALGTPLLFLGDEFGAGSPGDDDEVRPLPWHLLETDERRQALHARIRRLIHARHEHPALRADGCEVLVRDDERRLLVWQRWDEDGDRVLVALNASDETANLTVTVPEPGTWHELTLDYDCETGNDGGLVVELEPWQAQVLVPGT